MPCGGCRIWGSYVAGDKWQVEGRRDECGVAKGSAPAVRRYMPLVEAAVCSLGCSKLHFSIEGQSPKSLFCLQSMHGKPLTICVTIGVR